MLYKIDATAMWMGFIGFINEIGIIGMFFNITKLFPFHRLVSLGSIVIATFAISFGPFFQEGQTLVVLQRLFPFKRGLTHAYWAPNFWALYNAVDRIAISILRRVGSFGFLISDDCKINSGASTSGLVKDTVHCVLPQIPPIFTFILTLISQLPILWKLWYSRGDAVQFLRGVILCNFCSFIFGW